MPLLLPFLLVLSLAAAQNTVYYPPQSDSPSPAPLIVHAGDTINVTWSLTYSSVDLTIRASAPNANFTQTPFYNAALQPISYFTYVLQPRDYLVNDSSIPIAAYFLLSDHLDSTQFVNTENFTILQPASEAYANGQLTIPANAETWTGSVTLYSSIGIGDASSVLSTPTSTASLGALTETATAQSGSAASGLVSVVTVSATAAVAAATTTTAAAASNSTSSGLSSGAKAGLGVGVAVGILVLGGMALTAYLISRRRRREHMAGSGTSPQPMGFEAESKVQQLGTTPNHYGATGHGVYEVEGGRHRGSELDGDRPRVELGTGT
ncbi:hypothetical protein MMC17_002389 [Xylographa soralifera]|nr:hypothetical protein [Xylographa soralifera]